jgi:hypothetical protein
MNIAITMFFVRRRLHHQVYEYRERIMFVCSMRRNKTFRHSNGSRFGCGCDMKASGVSLIDNIFFFGQTLWESSGPSWWPSYRKAEINSLGGNLTSESVLICSFPWHKDDRNLQVFCKLHNSIANRTTPMSLEIFQ